MDVSDDDDDDDIILLDDRRRPHPQTDSRQRRGPSTAHSADSVERMSRSDRPSSRPVRHADPDSAPLSSNQSQQVQNAVRTQRIEDDTGISDVELIEDSDDSEVVEQTPTNRRDGYNRSQIPAPVVQPSSATFPALPAYQSPLGLSNRRIATANSSASSRASSSTASTHSRSIPPTSPSASRSVSLDTSFNRMNIERTPSGIAGFSDGSRSSTVSTPTPSVASSRSTPTGPTSRDKTPTPVNIRERIAQMRAQGLLNPPPSMLDNLAANSSIGRDAAAEQEHSSVQGSRGDTEGIEVKLELHDSDEEMPPRHTSKAKGKRPVQLPIHTNASLVRSVRSQVKSRDSDDEGDEWDELLEHASAKRTRKLQEGPSAATSRKSSALKTRFEPRGRAGTSKRTFQWVVPSVEVSHIVRMGDRKKELPSWMM